MVELQDVAILKKQLSDDERMQFDMQYNAQAKNPTTALILSLFLGGLGVDRFYVGDIGLGVGKLLTFGGLMVWAIIDLFFIMGAARRKNVEIAQSIRQSIDYMRR